MPQCDVNSRYNFVVPTDDGALLYNASSGAIIRLYGADAFDLANVLSSGCVAIEQGILPQELYGQLLGGGFLVPSGTDELSIIRERFLRARHETPIVLTLTATMDCNLGCYYCYESRSKEELKVTDIQSVLNIAKDRLFRSGKRSLHVDWYGGEPLLNRIFIDEASKSLRKFCDENSVSYAASVISNGTQWPEDIENFVRSNCIRQVQISFDGLRDNHNRRRRYLNRSSNLNSSSFDTAVALVDILVDYVRVDIRINIDRGNQNDLLPFVDFAQSRGWFNRNHPAVIQPARLASYSDRSSFMRRSELSIDDYETLRAAVRSRARSGVHLEDAEVPDGFPYPKTSVCAALAYDSEVIGSDGLRYRCGLQVGEKHRAVGKLEMDNSDTTAFFPDSMWWKNFDPTVLPNCSRCSFLPICLGGCPKKHLENDTHALHEQSLYWRKNLPRLIADGAGVKAPRDYSFAENDQFK